MTGKLPNSNFLIENTVITYGQNIFCLQNVRILIVICYFVHLVRVIYIIEQLIQPSNN